MSGIVFVGKKRVMKNVKLVVTAIFFLLLGTAAGYLVAKKMVGIQGKARHEAKAGKTNKRKILYYRNPMNPSITSPVPKKDEMGMDYVPVYEGGESQGPAGTVTINPVVEQNIGVRTDVARIRRLSHMVRAYGRIAMDEDLIYSVYPRFKGWIENVKVARKGDVVKKGQLLCTVYSPELVSTEQEYLVALKGMKILKHSDIGPIRENASSLVASAKRRLRLFGVGSDEIARLERTLRPLTSLAILSSVSGTVMAVRARQGLFVTLKSMLYQVADLSTVWVLADVYENDVPWIGIGNDAWISIEAASGRKLKGKVDFIYPYENPKKRTVQVRMVFPNKEGVLKPQMFANVVIMASPRTVLAVPSEAVIRTGIRKLVFVEKEKGRFEPREVETGIESDGFIEVRSGLSEGEKVVVSSQFLIDSESSLREATLKMKAPKKEMDAMKMDSGKTGQAKVAK